MPCVFCYELLGFTTQYVSGVLGQCISGQPHFENICFFAFLFIIRKGKLYSYVSFYILGKGNCQTSNSTREIVRSSSGSGYQSSFEPIRLELLCDLIFPTHSLASPQCYSHQTFMSLPHKEIAAGPGMSGRKSCWFMLCHCWQLPVSHITSQGPWTSPNIHLHKSL